jgi:hypothetical protein
MLPAGTDMNAAANGFKNQGQFIAAVHASTNLGLSFDQIKTKMVDEQLSLGRTIQALRPAASGIIEASRAQQQALSDLAEPFEAETSATKKSSSR